MNDFFNTLGIEATKEEKSSEADESEEAVSEASSEEESK